jgi:NitT/TauT family transport system substrate-binding protein
MRELTRRSSILIATAALVLAVGCGDSDSEEPDGGGSRSATTETQKVRIAIAPGSFLDLAPWIAQDQGFFGEQGLEVEAEIPTIPFSQLPSALGREYDIILGTQPDLINAGSRGLQLVAVGGVNLDGDRIPGSALVVPGGSDIADITDLAGRSVGAPSLTGNNWLTLECWADKAGVDPSSIRGIEAPAPEIPSLLEKGRFDSALLFEPLLGGVVAGGGENLGNSYANCFDEPMFTSMWISNREWAEGHGDAITGFLAALTEAKQYMLEHPREARQLYVERSGLPEAVAAKAPIDPTVFDFRPITVEDLEPWLELMRTYQGFDGDVDLSELVVN